jgi:hypothetical protein
MAHAAKVFEGERGRGENALPLPTLVSFDSLGREVGVLTGRILAEGVRRGSQDTLTRSALSIASTVLDSTAFSTVSLASIKNGPYAFASPKQARALGLDGWDAAVSARVRYFEVFYMSAESVVCNLACGAFFTFAACGTTAASLLLRVVGSADLADRVKETNEKIAGLALKYVVHTLLATDAVVISLVGVIIPEGGVFLNAASAVVVGLGAGGVFVCTASSALHKRIQSVVNEKMGDLRTAVEAMVPPDAEDRKVVTEYQKFLELIKSEIDGSDTPLDISWLSLWNAFQQLPPVELGAKGEEVEKVNALFIQFWEGVQEETRFFL